MLFNKVMAPIHDGLESVPLYNEEELVSVEICLDSGKVATDACRHDVRGSRIDSRYVAKVYPEDVPKETCDKHIMVDYCVDGVASEYCKNMANLGQVTLTRKALVKMTQEELDAIIEAAGNGLQEEYTKDNYIYLVDASGNPIPFYGIHGDINGGTNNCCQYCSKHDKKDWDSFLSGTN